MLGDPSVAYCSINLMFSLNVFSALFWSFGLKAFFFKLGSFKNSWYVRRDYT